MDVLALILACSLHHDDALVRVMVEVQSADNVYFVGDLATLKTRDLLTSADDALKAAEDIARHDGRPAVGLLGVPLEWAGRFGRQPRDLFDACTNIEIGTAMLSEYNERCSQESKLRGRSALRSRHRKGRKPSLAASRGCILTKLGQDLGIQSAPVEILKILTSRGPLGPLPPDSSGIFGAEPADIDYSERWSSSRLYVTP